MTDLSNIKSIKNIIENADLIIRASEISHVFDQVLKICLSKENENNIIMMEDAVTSNFLKLLRLEQQNDNHKEWGKYLKLAPDI